MREIKYRGKDTKTGEWIFGDLLHHDERVGICTQNGDGTMNLCDVIAETVGQSTGLFDKKGREIYEGDVVEAWSEGLKAMGEVVQRIDGLWILYPAFQKKTFWGLMPNASGKTTVEIIGNRFENPELLEEE